MNEVVKYNSRVSDSAVNNHMFEDPSTSFSWARGLKILSKYRLIFILVPLVSVFLGLLACFLITPKYVSQVSLKIDFQKPQTFDAQNSSIPGQQKEKDSYLRTIVEELKSFSVGDRVLQSSRIRAQLDDFFDEGSGFSIRRLLGLSGNSIQKNKYYVHSEKVLEQYQDLISVRPQGDSSIILLKSKTTDPQLSADIANLHAQEYLAWSNQQRLESFSDNLSFLKKEARELVNKIKFLEQERINYAEQNDLKNFNQDLSLLTDQINQLNQLLTSATAKRIQIEKLYQEAVKAQSEGNFDNAVFDDPSLQETKARLGDMEAELSLLKTKFTSSYPKVKQLTSRVESLKESIHKQRMQILNGIETKFLAAQDEEKNLKEELERLEALSFQDSKKQVGLNAINQKLVSSKDLLAEIQSQIEEVSVSAKDPSSIITIVDHAVPAAKSSSPNIPLVLALSLILGMLSSAGAAFALQYFDHSLDNPDQLQDLIKVPTLGIVPAFECESRKGLFSKKLPDYSIEQTLPAVSEKSKKLLQESEIIYLNSPLSQAAESFRTIRSSLLLSSAEEPPKKILITSSVESEGKTTFSVNLALSLIGSGKSVALIDADMRRPSVQKYFNFRSDKLGLSNFLTGQASITDAAVSVVPKKFLVIPAGNIPPNPSELLSSKPFQGLVDKLSEKFDHVIIDSPPVLPVTDAMILSKFVSGVVLVVNAQSAHKKALQDAKKRLDQIGAVILGSVVNNVDLSSSSYSYYNKYYFSEYLAKEVA